jgi:hypothetical protein
MFFRKLVLGKGNPPVFYSLNWLRLCGHRQPLLLGESTEGNVRSFAIIFS